MSHNLMTAPGVAPSALMQHFWQLTSASAWKVRLTPQNLLLDGKTAQQPQGTLCCFVNFATTCTSICQRHELCFANSLLITMPKLDGCPVCKSDWKVR